MTLRLAQPLLQDFARIAAVMRDDEREQFCAMQGLAHYDPDTAARVMANYTGPTWVLVDDAGMPLLLGGFEPIRAGVYECWMAGSLEQWAAHWHAFTRIGRRLIADLFQHGAHRVQTCALASRTAAHKWYASVGLSVDGVLPRYCANGEDAIMFSRVSR